MGDGLNRVVRYRYAIMPLLMLTGCCGTLLWINHDLQQENRLLGKQLSSLAAAKGPAVGSTISILRGHSISGEAVSFDLSHREGGTLLFVLSPVCPYSNANLHNWRDLLPLVPPDRVIWVDLTGKADAGYLNSAAIPASSNVIRLDPEERTLYNLQATPTTVLLNSHGVVMWAWASTMDDVKLSHLRDLLKTPRVPGPATKAL